MKKSISIYLQAAAAMMLVLFLHYVTHSIPDSFERGTGGIIEVSIFAGMLLIGIILVFWLTKVGLLIGFLIGAWVAIHEVLMHVILGQKVDGVVWYPVLPFLVAVMVMYFNWLAWKNWDKQE